MAQKKNNKAGFSLVENLIAIAIFVLLAIVIYQTSALLVKSVGVYRQNVTISSLANQYMEIVHNLPYSSIGTENGNPHGDLPDLPNATQLTINDVLYKIYYVVNYIDDPADGTILNGTDSASNDYKQVKLYIKNLSSDKTYNFVTNITPKGLEGLENGGALYIKVFDAVGQPVPNATINILNESLVPNINLTRTTDASGNWVEVGLPDNANSYHITATKSGYSSDQTYPSTVDNPNPTKPDSTVALGQVTQISFSIDKLSTLSFSTLDENCQLLSGIGMDVRGAKLIGTPNLFKFDHHYTSNSSGEISLGSLEWDNYTPDITGSTYMIYGSSPIQQVTILPDTNQNFTLLLGPKTTYGLLVIVKDATTLIPIEGASVRLQNFVLDTDSDKVTGGSVWGSTNWTGGPGQIDWSDPTKYFEANNISADDIPTALRLVSYDNGVTYIQAGNLTSSVFDTGTISTAYTTLTWQPTSESPGTYVKFQIAVSNTNTATTTWDFIGTDGTDGSFYTTSGITINAPDARYVRYKAFLNSDDPSKTPVLTGIDINYVSGCFTPGQVFFPGLASSTDYQITAGAPGYITQTIIPLEINGYHTLEILLNH